MRGKKANVNLVFHALGDPTRRAIVEKLSQGPMSVTQLAGPLDITVTAVAQHLQVLESSGLVRSEKVGRVRTCHLDLKRLDTAEQWIRDRRAMWAKRLDRLGEFLEQTDPESITDPKK